MEHVVGVPLTLDLAETGEVGSVISLLPVGQHGVDVVLVGLTAHVRPQRRVPVAHPIARPLDLVGSGTFRVDSGILGRGQRLAVHEGRGTRRNPVYRCLLYTSRCV